MSKRLVIANWKMNGSRKDNDTLLRDLLESLSILVGVSVVICPPFPYIAQVSQTVATSAVKLGAQNLSEFAKGAYTGEVSASMLKDLGCQFVLVGHSERRSLFGESDRLVADKYEAALKADLTPVLCVGETLEQRQAGETEAVVSSQLKAVLDRVGMQGIAAGVIAYEPVWAIGTGETASPEQAQAVHQHIRRQLAQVDPIAAATLSILYGGSVKAENASDIFNQPDIDGGLIGGASLDATSFKAICHAALR